MKNLQKKMKFGSWRIVLIITILLSALVLGIIQKFDTDDSYQEKINSSEVVELSETICDDSGGEWESCGSACRSEEAEDSETICVEVCTAYCHCHGDGECPEDHICDEFIEDTGVCVLDF